MITLQALSPAVTDESITVVTRVNAEQTGQQLFARLVDEVKTQKDGSGKLAEAATPFEQTQQILHLLKGFRAKSLKIKDYQAGNEILGAAPEVQVSMVGDAMSRLVNARHLDMLADRLSDELLKTLLRKKLPYQSDDVSRMLKLVVADSLIGVHLPINSIMSNVERFVEGTTLPQSAEHSLKELAKTFYPDAWTSDERKVGEKITAILNADSTRERMPGSKDKSVADTKTSEQGAVSSHFATGEVWTEVLLVELGKLSETSRMVWSELLDHCATATASKPSKKWLTRSGEILQRVPHAQFATVLCPALQMIGQPGKCQKTNYGGRVQYSEPTEVHDTHVDLLRGLVWSASLVDNVMLIASIGDAAEKCFQKIREIGPRCPKVGNACLLSLSTLATIPAVAQLGRLKARAKHASTRKQIEKAYVRAAGIAGMTPDDLIEIAVPDFGMKTPGLYQESIGDFTAQFALDANRNPQVMWIKSDGKSQGSVPADLKKDHADALKALQRRVKEIEKLIPSIRSRLEHLFLSQRSWNLKEFRQRFLEHPVVAVVARKLIWNLTIGDQVVPAIWHHGEFVEADAAAVSNVDDSTHVSIWHPMEASVSEVLQWRTWLEENQVCQPFKQAHREIYVLTDAERQTAIYSNRFAAHIVRQHQMSALCSQRGWRYGLQGDWDSWNAPYIDLPQHGIRAEFFVEPLDGLNDLTQSFVYTHLSTDQVRFLSLDENGACNLAMPLLLENIPSLVFSEVMRDVDLFVGVTSIGNDPNWQEIGEPAYTEYWQKYSFGELSDLAKTRKQIIELAISRLGLSERCHVEGRFLKVRGNIRKYKIHFGSGNVLMSPNDQYLCIVQKRDSGTKQTDKIFLPFDGDNTLSLILSKAFLLIDDDKIKDATIANQIRLD